MRLLLLLPVAALCGACEGDNFAAGRADTGIIPTDSGVDEALAYRPGMRFAYRGQLNYRSSTNNEKDALFDLTFTLTAVDDRGAMGMSTVTATAAGARTFDQNWDATAGAHSWVALSGPVDTGDRVSGNATTFVLAEPPEQPPFPKRLPPPALFFLDLRRAEDIRRAFTETYAAVGPRFISPAEDPRGRWVLALDGRDAAMDFYPDAARRRKLDLAYDRRGWLVEISETLGDTTLPNSPSGRFTLTLMEGPE